MKGSLDGLSAKALDSGRKNVAEFQSLKIRAFMRLGCLGLRPEKYLLDKCCHELIPMGLDDGDVAIAGWNGDKTTRAID